MRTDSEIQKDVKDELSWSANVKSDDVNVEVKDGFVTLSGTLDSYARKVAAENAALSVIGVADVTNKIEIKLGKASERSDSDIEEAVYNTLKWNSSIKEEDVKVNVKEGWVTLEGEVEWDFQKRSATRAVEELTGVKGVTNSIKIVSKSPTTDEIKDRISSALKRNVNGEDITVAIINDKVILSGKVHSFAEKFNAEKAVWSAPGVTKVQNKLVISPVRTYA